MFRDISYYKPDLDASMARVRAFFDCAPDAPGALIITFPSVLTLRGPALNKYNFDIDLDAYLHDYLEYQAGLMEIRRGIEDDWIPSVVPYMGIGEFSAFVAGEIEFGEDTSWVKPILREKHDLNSLCLDPRNKWFVRLNSATRYMVQHIAPFRIPFGRGYYSPLDLAWALRGEAIYMDFYEDPDWVHKLLRFSVQATIWFARAQVAEIFAPEFQHELSAWHCGPNRVAVGEDISSLCSPAHYNEFGALYTQQVFDTFGIGEIHCHSAGPHVVPEFLKLKRVRQIQIVADPNTARPVEILEGLMDGHPGLFGRLPSFPVIALDVTADEARDHYDLCKRARIVFSVVTDEAAESSEAVRMFRSRQAL